MYPLYKLRKTDKEAGDIVLGPKNLEFCERISKFLTMIRNRLSLRVG